MGRFDFEYIYSGTFPTSCTGTSLAISNILSRRVKWSNFPFPSLSARGKPLPQRSFHFPYLVSPSHWRSSWWSLDVTRIPLVYFLCPSVVAYAAFMSYPTKFVPPAFLTDISYFCFVAYFIVGYVVPQ
ncbi:hypothetical protein Tcan_00063 [Toxocara canis]|uniref:Uncharacterized protein n=1 Tax=Toxocara canis TaxID=6265 RepID=A0A0B2VI89_TOXCA|nr:hypothetical protein Tcan_00063 [Toxocara canis]